MRFQKQVILILVVERLGVAGNNIDSPMMNVGLADVVGNNANGETSGWKCSKAANQKDTNARGGMLGLETIVIAASIVWS